MDDVQNKVAQAVQRITKTKPTTTRNKKAEVFETTGNGYARVVKQTVPCGWCITETHEDCKPTITWNNTLYVCGCNPCQNKIFATLDEAAQQSINISVESKSQPENQEED